MQFTNATYFKILITLIVILVVPSTFIFKNVGHDYTYPNVTIMPIISDNLTVIPLKSYFVNTYIPIIITPTVEPTAKIITVKPSIIPDSNLKILNPNDIVASGANLNYPSVSSKGISLDIDNSYIGRGFYYKSDIEIFKFKLMNSNSFNLKNITVTENLMNLETGFIYTNKIIEDSKINVYTNSKFDKYYTFKPLNNLESGKYKLVYNITGNGDSYCIIFIEIYII